NHLPFQIVESLGSYQLLFPKDYPLIVDFLKKIPSHDQLLWDRLLLKSDKEKYSRSEIMQALDIPLTTANRFLHWAMDCRKLERVGSGRSTAYLNLEKKSPVKSRAS